MNHWFTADTHLGHGRIIEYCKRPFFNSEEMEEVTLHRFNEVLRPGDTLFHLGDIAWSSYPLERFFSRLRTKQVQLILGNHDRKKHSEYSKHCTWVGDLKGVTLPGGYAVLCHYPLRSWNRKGHGSVHLYGHVHGNLPGHDRSLDVGVDTKNFYPWHWDEIRDRLKDVPLFSDRDPDHHTPSIGVNVSSRGSSDLV